MNTNSGVIDNASGGQTTVSLSSTNVTLTVDQAAYNLIILSGVLTANVQLIFPGTIGGRRFIQNGCTGNFTVRTVLLVQQQPRHAEITVSVPEVCTVRQTLPVTASHVADSTETTAVLRKCLLKRRSTRSGPSLQSVLPRPCGEGWLSSTQQPLRRTWDLARAARGHETSTAAYELVARGHIKCSWWATRNIQPEAGSTASRTVGDRTG